MSNNKKMKQNVSYVTLMLSYMYKSQVPLTHYKYNELSWTTERIANHAASTKVIDH